MKYSISNVNNTQRPTSFLHFLHSLDVSISHFYFLLQLLHIYCLTHIVVLSFLNPSPLHCLASMDQYKACSTLCTFIPLKLHVAKHVSRTVWKSNHKGRVTIPNHFNILLVTSAMKSYVVMTSKLIGWINME